jgi:hypothetical protein
LKSSGPSGLVPAGHRTANLTPGIRCGQEKIARVDAACELLAPRSPGSAAGVAATFPLA